jgi:hypothetical protein
VEEGVKGGARSEGGKEEVGGEEEVVLDAVAVPREMLGGSSYGSFSSALPAMAAGILNTNNTCYIYVLELVVLLHMRQVSRTASLTCCERDLLGTQYGF